jgi:hypothetical protein
MSTPPSLGSLGHVGVTLAPHARLGVGQSLDPQRGNPPIAPLVAAVQEHLRELASGNSTSCSPFARA